MRSHYTLTDNNQAATMFYYLKIQGDTAKAVELLGLLSDIKYSSGEHVIVWHARLQRCQLKRIESQLGNTVTIDLLFANPQLDITLLPCTAV